MEVSIQSYYNNVWTVTSTAPLTCVILSFNCSELGKTTKESENARFWSSYCSADDDSKLV